MKEEKIINDDRMVVLLPKKVKDDFNAYCKLVDGESGTSGKNMRKLIRGFIDTVKLMRE